MTHGRVQTGGGNVPRALARGHRRTACPSADRRRRCRRAAVRYPRARPRRASPQGWQQSSSCRRRGRSRTSPPAAAAAAALPAGAARAPPTRKQRPPRPSTTAQRRRVSRCARRRNGLIEGLLRPGHDAAAAAAAVGSQAQQVGSLGSGNGGGGFQCRGVCRSPLRQLLRRPGFPGVTPAAHDPPGLARLRRHGAVLRLLVLLLLQGGQKAALRVCGVAAAVGAAAACMAAAQGPALAKGLGFAARRDCRRRISSTVAQAVARGRVRVCTRRHTASMSGTARRPQRGVSPVGWEHVSQAGIPEGSMQRACQRKGTNNDMLTLAQCPC